MKKENKDPSNEIKLDTGIGIFKKISISISVIALIILFGLLSLQAIIKLDKYKETINSEIASLMQTEPNSNIVPSASINGNISFKSFLVPHITIDNIIGKDLNGQNYLLNFDIQKLRLFLSPKDLIAKKFIITKIEIINGNFNFQEFNESQINIIKNIIDKHYGKFINKDRNIVIILKNNSIKINGTDYTRDFSQINLTGTYNKNKLLLNGSTLSNKQSLNIDISTTKKQENFINKIYLNSQAFRINMDFNFDSSNKKASGKATFNIINPQIFARTIFSPQSVLFKRIIDNSNLDIVSEFNFENNILNISKFNMKGKNVIGDATAKFDFNDNSQSDIKINMASINLDNLFIKNMSGNIDKEINERNISIFSGVQRQIIKQNRNISFIEKILEKNPINFDINIKKLKLNQRDVSNTIIQFIYSTKAEKTFDFKKVSSELPGKTKVLIEENNENDFLQINGENLQEFFNFIRNINIENNKSNQQETKEENFKFSGNIQIKNNMLFINNASYESPKITTKNKLEIKFDSGISYLAVDTIIDNLNLDNFITDNSNTSTQNVSYIKSFKTQMLSLNNFTLNSYFKFKINNIKYKDFIDDNYQFIIKTSQGLLDIYNININNKITGNISFNISASKPFINVNLNLSNISLNKNIDINKILFNLPMFDGIFGSINILANNLDFKNSKIENINFMSNINNGAININQFDIKGFGGQCKISGFLNLLYTKKLNLTFNGCTAKISDILYPFSGLKNINGLIGFSSVLYAEGFNLENFINSYLLKANIIGSGIVIDNFGLQTLSSNLFEIHSNTELLNRLNAEDTLYNSNEKTFFEQITKGNIQYSKKSGGRFDFDITRPLINGKLTGNFKLFSNYVELDKVNANFTLLSGTLQTTIPLTILIAMSGITPNNIAVASNLNQINSYIQSVKEQYKVATQNSNNLNNTEQSIQINTNN